MIATILPPTPTRELIEDAARQLDAYHQSGIFGFREQAYDRLRAAGVDYSKIDPRHLRDHLRQHWGV